MDETVEEAPIIVPKPELLDSNPHDEVKREIESMMAMHGIRMEGEDISSRELRPTNGGETAFADKHMDVANMVKNCLMFIL